MALPSVSAAWVSDVREALAGFRKVAVGQLVPGGERYELVLTTLHSPPEADVVEAIEGAIGDLARREDSPIAEVGDGGSRSAAWHFYPALTEHERQLFAGLEWAHAILVHERLD